MKGGSEFVISALGKREYLIGGQEQVLPISNSWKESVNPSRGHSDYIGGFPKSLMPNG